ncbi:acyltransferase 3 [Minicystis rosea]|nr:acyltransferase 3 [Minicystis rosea]
MPSEHPSGEVKGRARPTGGFYRPELDGVRCLAFLAVFVAHAFHGTPDEIWLRRFGSFVGPWIAALLRSGRFGVDLFFVLSAYLITEILLRERSARGAVDVKAFWARRILRIWPLYFVFVIAGILVAPRVLLVEHLSHGYAAAFLLFAGNWAIALHGWQTTVLAHLWSVSIEEQFYLSWPLVMRRLGRRALLGVSGALLPIAIATRAWLIAAHGDGTGPEVWVNTIARLDPIALGILLAVYLDGRPIAWSRSLARIALAGGAFAIVGVARLDPLFTRVLVGSMAYTVVAVACTAIVAGALVLGPRSVLATRAAVYVGKISYGAYVFHLFFVRLVSQRITHHAAAPLLMLALTIATAAISYRWLESPFLKLKDRFARSSARREAPSTGEVPSAAPNAG